MRRTCKPTRAPSALEPSAPEAPGVPNAAHLESQALLASAAPRRGWLRDLYQRLVTKLAHLIVAFQSPR